MRDEALWGLFVREGTLMSPIFPTRYQFLIDGEVSDRVKAAFPQLQVGRSVGGFTTLFGLVSDHSSLRSIMARLDALGLTLAELRRLPD